MAKPTARISRRTLVGGLAVILGSPQLAAAQPSKQSTIGILVLGNPDPARMLAIVREELAKLGYAEGRNIRIELRSAKGNTEQLTALAAELVRLPVDVLVTWLTPPTIAARDATRTVPIVMISAGDPVATGIVASLSRPGGNVTGTSAIAAELMIKNVELIREMLPDAKRVAAFANSVDPFTNPYLHHIEATAAALGINVERVMAHPAEDPAPYLEAMRAKNFDAVILQPTLLRPGIAGLALKHRLPAVAMVTQFPHAGGLMAYGPNTETLWRSGVVYIDRVLNGQSPANLPIAQPTKFDLVINLKTAKALGLAVPPSLLARADDVIE